MKTVRRTKQGTCLPSPSAFTDGPGEHGGSAAQNTVAWSLRTQLSGQSLVLILPLALTTCVVLGRLFKLSVSVSSPVKWE